MRRVIVFRACRVLGVLLIFSQLDHAVVLAQTWNGGGADANWTTNANWINPPNAPLNDGSADVHFAGTTQLTPMVDTPYSVNSITFDSGSGNFVMAGSQLTIGAGGVTNSSTNLQSFNNAIVLNGPQTWTAATGDVLFASTIDLAGNALTIDGASNTTITGIISTSSSGGSLVKNGTGLLLLGAANTYDGGTTVNAGTLQGDTTSLQGNITVMSPGTLAFNQTNGDGTYLGVIDGDGAVTVSGSNVVTFMGANVYTGGTTVSSGTLQAGAAGALPDNTPYTVNGGVLDLNNHNLIASSLNGTGGTITLGTASLTVNNPDATATDSFSGVISGAGSLIKQGDSTLTLGGANNYTGGTTVSGGTLQGTTTSLQGAITNNATVTFNQSTDGTYSGVISGSGDVTKEGTGNASLSGINLYTGTTTVNAGTLSINGSIVSATTVNASGTLSGTGTISNSVTNNGTVAAGVGGSGTLTVDSFTNSAGATVEVDITPGGTGGKLAVTGAADLTAGGTVNVNAAAGNYNAGQKFTFLTAAGGVTGQFDSITDNLSGLTPILGEDGTSVFFTLLRNGTTYAAIARTQNQLAVGTYLDRVSPTATGDLSTVLNGINVISDDEARAAFDQLGGPIHATLAQIGVQNTSMVIYQVAKRLRSGPFTPGGGISVADDDRRGRGAPIALVDCDSDGEPCYQGCSDEGASHASGWVLGYGQGGAARSDGNAPGVSFGMGGTVAGMEHWADDCHLFGFYGGYVGTDVRTATMSHDSGINGGQFGGYIFMDDGFSYYTALGGFEFDGYSTSRLLDFDDVNRTALSNYDGWQSFAYLERGFSFQSCNSVFQPFVAIQYIYLRQNSFTESGADSVDLAGSGATANSLRSMLGARWQYAMMNRNGLRTLPELHALWMHEYLDSNTSVSEQFSPTPTGSSAFSIQGLDFGRDWAVLGVNLTWEMHDCWSMYVNYDIESNARETVHVGTGGLAHMW